jgi:Dirigent-like protein
MGPVVLSGEWAIVGGTGVFLLAQGTIYKELLKANSNSDIIKLDIHAFYSPKSSKNPIWSLGDE